MTGPNVPIRGGKAKPGKYAGISPLPSPAPPPPPEGWKPGEAGEQRRTVMPSPDSKAFRVRQELAVGKVQHKALRRLAVHVETLDGIASNPKERTGNRIAAIRELRGLSGMDREGEARETGPQCVIFLPPLGSHLQYSQQVTPPYLALDVKGNTPSSEGGAPLLGRGDRVAGEGNGEG